MRIKRQVLLSATCLVMLCAVCACNGSLSHSNRVVVLQPFDDCPTSLTTAVHKGLIAINPAVVLKAPIRFPEAAYYTPRNRYRADSLIRYLAQWGSPDTVMLGLTTRDISTTKGNAGDWGIMGLAFRPGNACVVSSFRLAKEKRTAQFYKVAIHELGHTQGLPHCKIKSCFMRDAEGGNPLDEETDFCKSCKAFLVSKGWALKEG